MGELYGMWILLNKADIKKGKRQLETQKKKCLIHIELPAQGSELLMLRAPLSPAQLALFPLRYSLALAPLTAGTPFCPAELRQTQRHY